MMKNKKLRNMSFSNRMFYIFNFVFWMIVLFIVLYPLYLVCISSISDPDAVNAGKVIWKPVNIFLEGYKMVFEDSRLMTSYLNSIFYVVAGVFLSVTITTLAGYVMSRRVLFGKTILNWFFLITMFFGGGLIPTFLTVKNLGLYNTRTIIILLGSFSVWNMMLTRVYIQTTIPEELYEAATLDGASHFQYFTKVVLPLSKTILAVLAVYYGVGKWNDYFTGLVYLRDEALYPLQTVLQSILAAAQVGVSEESLVAMADNAEGLMRARKIAGVAKYCMIVVSTGPVIVLFVALQKYFEKGVMIGSLKG